MKLEMLKKELSELISAYRVYSQMQGLLTNDERLKKHKLERKIQRLRAKIENKSEKKGIE